MSGTLRSTVVGTTNQRQRGPAAAWPSDVASASWRWFKTVAPYVPMLAINGSLGLLLRDPGPFFPAADYPFLGQVEAEWEKIASEVDDLLLHGPPIPEFEEQEPGQGRLWRTFGTLTKHLIRDQVDGSELDTLHWKAFELVRYGVDVPANCDHCPNTAALLRTIPGVFTAMVSILEPGARLPMHIGLYKGVLRSHLGVRVPDGDLGMRVGREVQRWRQGSFMVFDDTHLHSAWNAADGPRVVLLVDFERPMPWPWLGKLNHTFIELLKAFGRATSGTNLERR